MTLPDVVAVGLVVLGVLGLALLPFAGPWAGVLGGVCIGAAVGGWAARRPAAPRVVTAETLHNERLATVGLMAGGVAHDLNNVLSAAIGHAELAAAAAPDTQTAKHAIQAASAVERGADLVRQLLVLAGKTPPLPAPVVVPDLARETANLVRVGVPAGVRLTVTNADNVPLVVGHAIQLRQVVLNLLLNGAEAVGRSSGEVSVRVTGHEAAPPGVAVAGPVVCVEVTDTGSGMDPTTASKMFDPFFTTKPTGRGLGLSSVRGAVEAHKGVVRVSSEPGRGTTVAVWLPATPDAQPASSVDTPRTLGATPPRPPVPAVRHVALVVDDDDALRTLLSEQLVQLNWEVLTASSGSEAVELFRQAADRVGLVLLDLDLAGESGADTLVALRRIRSVPVLVCTGNTDDSAAAEALACGASGVLLKPYRRTELARAVSRVTEQKPTTS